ncbi:MAG: ATP-binding protein [Actinomycetes bacterium]
MAGEVPSSALVGRAVELHRLDAVLERAGQGSPQVVLVAGDAGVGKTRLLLALADRARRRGMRVLMGASVELGDIGLPYLPVVDALRELADDPEGAGLLTGAAMTAPVLGRLLPGIEPAGLAGGDLDQLQVLDAVRAVLVGLAERSPVVLVLEDLHWADRATRDLVAFLARTLRSGRVTVAVSYRPDELHRRHPLRPLLAELVRLPAVERWSWPPSPGPSWTSTWRRSPVLRCRRTGWRTSSPARRETRSTPSSCWPPGPPTPGSSCRRPWPRCCWPGSRGCRSRPSGCCGWRRSWAAGCPTGCWPASPASPRPSWRRA